MAKSNRQRVDDVLQLVGLGLRPFVEGELSRIYPGDDWAGDAAARGNWSHEKAGKKPNPDDEDFLCWVVINHWQNVFRKVLGPIERGYITELREARGRFAHREGFTMDATARVCDTAYLLLSSIGAPEASQVDEIRTEVQRLRFEEKRPATTQALPGMDVGANGGLKPWRDVIEPHEDVATGRYQQAEFAADLAQVQRGGGLPEYRDPVEFFRRTFLTRGLRDLLIQTMRRLSGSGGEPVIDLLTNFGGGKTHSLLAVYHLCDQQVTPDSLPGIDSLLAESGIPKFPAEVTRAVMVGTALSPHRLVDKPDGCTVRTLWGEMAWQLGGVTAYELVREADENSVNPGSDVLRDLFELCGPAVILIDEWVAYARQLWNRDDLHGGSFDTQMSFAQSLAEAVKAVPNVMLLVSIPASDRFKDDGSPEDDADNDTGIEVGGQGGLEALKRLRNVIHRSDSPWQPATAEEGFEIVRRRLFKGLDADGFKHRDETARALVGMYQRNTAEFPSDSREPIYEERIRRAYPIHPELFDRLYQDWAALERFQRTRGVLRLMAAVVHSLWINGDQRPVIMPSSIPLDDTDVFEEVTRHLEDNWKPVVDADVDGAASIPAALDRENQAFGRAAAARRVARTVFMGSAPTLQRRVGGDGSAVQNPNRGIDDLRVKLGCVLPGETGAVFGDALRRLTDKTTHLYVDGSRYWFSTTASVARIAQDLADGYSIDKVHESLADWVRTENDRGCFARVHRMPAGPADVDDEPTVGLVILRPEYTHASKAGRSAAIELAEKILEQRQGGARIHKNMVVFLAADATRLEELELALRQHMAWSSISGRRDDLNLDRFGITQTETKLAQAADTIRQRINETYVWLLAPQQDPTDRALAFNAVKVDSNGTMAERVTRKVERDTTVITTYGASNLRLELDRIPLWRGDHVSVAQVWEDFTSHVYLPRLRDLSVLLGAVADGPRTLDLDRDGFGYAESYDEKEGRYRGLVVNEGVGSPVADGLSVVVRPSAAKSQASEIAETQGEGGSIPVEAGTASGETTGTASTGPTLPRRYFGRKTLNPTRVGLNASEIANEILAHLTPQDGVTVEVTIEINATGPGFDQATTRVVMENAAALNLDASEFE
jgi:predicted AAA+ superfamily ATPase